MKRWEKIGTSSVYLTLFQKKCHQKRKVYSQNLITQQTLK